MRTTNNLAEHGAALDVSSVIAGGGSLFAWAFLTSKQALPKGTQSQVRPVRSLNNVFSFVNLIIIERYLYPSPRQENN